MGYDMNEIHSIFTEVNAKKPCDECNESLSPGIVPITITFDDDDLEVSNLPAREEFVNAIRRAGLNKPSDYLYISSVHAAAINKFIFQRDELKKTLIWHYHQHNHHHMSLSSKPPLPITIIITTTTTCQYHHYNHHHLPKMTLKSL